MRQNLHRLLVERLGLGVTAHRVVQPRQVVQRGGVVGMPLAQGRATNLHRLLVERLGLGVTAHRVVQHRQVVQRGGVVGMPLAQGRATNLHRLLVERLGLGVLSRPIASGNKPFDWGAVPPLGTPCGPAQSSTRRQWRGGAADRRGASWHIQRLGKAWFTARTARSAQRRRGASSIASLRTSWTMR